MNLNEVDSKDLHNLDLIKFHTLVGYQVEELKVEVKAISKRLRFLEFVVLGLVTALGREAYLRWFIAP
jgi:hypothetical protein